MPSFSIPMTFSFSLVLSCFFVCLFLYIFLLYMRFCLYFFVDVDFGALIYTDRILRMLASKLPKSYSFYCARLVYVWDMALRFYAPSFYFPLTKLALSYSIYNIIHFFAVVGVEGKNATTHSILSSARQYFSRHCLIPPPPPPLLPPQLTHFIRVYPASNCRRHSHTILFFQVILQFFVLLSFKLCCCRCCCCLHAVMEQHNKYSICEKQPKIMYIFH